MKRSINFSVVLLFISTVLFAQDEFDAIRFGHTNIQGTARGIGLGMAAGSMGGDFSALSVNPAGIGIYRRSEVSITPGITSSNFQTNYLSNNTTDSKTKFQCMQGGLVLTRAKSGNAYKRSAWKSTAFAIGFNRLANFNYQYAYSGTNLQNSIVNKWANDINELGGVSGIPYVNYSAYGAYQTYLIDKNYAGDTSLVKSYVPVADGIKQSKQLIAKGGMNEMVITVGGNYMEKLMLGATVGFVFVDYNRDLYFTEEDASGKKNNDFASMKYHEALSTSGTGINLKLGAIYKPSAAFRLGFAVHTPTAISLSDVSSIDISSNTDSLLLHGNVGASSITTYQQDTAQAFNYTLYTPYKIIGSATLLFKKYGLITADIAYTDFSTLRYDYGSSYKWLNTSMNNTIKNTFTSALQINAGGEIKLQDVSFRAGLSYAGSPYKNNPSAYSVHYSVGIGYRTNTWYIDAAYVYTTQQTQEKPYTLIDNPNAVPVATLTQRTNQLVVTLGRKF